MKKCKVFDSIVLFRSIHTLLRIYNIMQPRHIWMEQRTKSTKIRALANQLDENSFKIKSLTLCPSTLVQSVRIL